VPHGEALETMHSAVSPSPGFELALLRKSVGELADARDRCVHCHRTPLVGERVYLYAERIVCELCRPRRREAPQGSELMRSPEHDRAVRVRRL
jgi:recombinational DNA repair protein (RecF pathway)